MAWSVHMQHAYLLVLISVITSSSDENNKKIRVFNFIRVIFFRLALLSLLQWRRSDAVFPSGTATKRSGRMQDGDALSSMHCPPASALNSLSPCLTSPFPLLALTYFLPLPHYSCTHRMGEREKWATWLKKGNKYAANDHTCLHAIAPLVFRCRCRCRCPSSLLFPVKID